MVCAPHRMTKNSADIRRLEVPHGTVIDDRPIGLYTLRHSVAEVRKGLGPTNGDVQRRVLVERVATFSGAQTEAKANGVVAALGSDDHADLFPPPVADILEDSVVRRISHSRYDDVGFYRKVKNIVRELVCAPHRVKLTEDSAPEDAGRSQDRTP